MKKQITFENNSYEQDTRALEWLLNLSKCFKIKSVKMKTYKIETAYTIKYRCKVEVSYE